MKFQPFRCSALSRAAIAAASALALLLPLSAAQAADAESGPGRGLTAQFETDFLKSMIDHHYSALRMSELAAGTDATRDADIGRYAEGTSPTPGFAATPAKARSAHLRSMARRENRVQREEIAEAQRMLRLWYGQSHEPRIDDMGRRMIELLDAAAAGTEFDHTFMETMARHHYMGVTMATECLVAADVRHDPLHRYCSDIQHAQLSEIAEFRDQLCNNLKICDYQPLTGLRGRHTGSGNEPGGSGD